MKLLIQVGNLGSSVMDHLITPIAHVGKVNRILVFCHNPGPVIKNVEYHCPPKFLAVFPFLAVIWETINLFCYALFDRSVIVLGFLLNPHGIIAFIVAKLTRRKMMVYLIAGRHEFFTNDRNQGSIRGIDFNSAVPPWYGRLFLIILRHTNAIITTGSVTKRFLARHGIDDNKIYPIISPVNSSRFYKINLPKIYDVVSIGNLQLIKHHEILLQAISEVKKKRPNIKVCIVGDGPRKSRLIQLANELGIRENVDFVGYQRDVPNYYNRSSMLVHTSETEGFPNVVLEAMMCELPCVVSNCGDIIDIAKDGLNSLIIQKFNNYEEFAKNIIYLLEHDKFYDSLSQNAITTAKSISIEKVSKQWELAIYCLK
jgi:glycosyltransferase involved in cell wall biosynthesis